MSSLLIAAKRLRYLQFWFVAALAAVDAISFSASSLAATSANSFQVTAVVLNTCSMAVTPLAVPRNVVKVNCQYGQAYTVNVEPAVVDVAPDKSAASLSGNAMIVTVTY